MTTMSSRVAARRVVDDRLGIKPIRAERVIAHDLCQRLAGQAEDSLAEDVAHDVAGATHDRVRRAIGDGLVEVVVGDRFHAEHRGGVGDVLLMFGAEALGGGGEAGRRLLQRLAVDEHPAESVPGLEAGDLLADPGVARVGHDGTVVQRLVRDEPIDAAPLVFELGHRLLEGVALDTDKVLAGTRTSSK